MKAKKLAPFDIPASRRAEPANSDGDGPETQPFKLNLEDRLESGSPESGSMPPVAQEARSESVEPPPPAPMEFRLPERPQEPGGGPSSPPRDDGVAGARVYVGAAVLSVLWALAPVMFALGYRHDVAPFQNDVFAIAVFGLMALGPVCLVWILAFVLNQGLRLAAEMRRAQALTESMVAPAALAAGDAGDVVSAIRIEIERATEAAVHAKLELSALRQALAAESDRLIAAAEQSGAAAGAVTSSLSAEREKMNVMASVLDAQAVEVTEAINRHTRTVAEASDLAQTQVREAEAVLAARAADLVAAAGAAGDAARVAGEDLERQVARLETAGLGVGDQVRLVEEGLTEQRAALVAAAHGMRSDHESFAAETETQLARLNEVILHARTGASVLSEAASENAESLQRLIAQAAERLHELSETAAEERDILSAAAVQSMGAVSQVAMNERQALEDQTREAVIRLNSSAEQAIEAANRQVEIARHKVDQLAEAAFAAGVKADAVFDARLNDARALIEQSSQLIADAGEKSAKRFDDGAAAARLTLQELENLLAQVDARVAQLPAEAQSRAEGVRQTIERGMEELMASARKAAEETQTIDAAFQERVRRNYEMLSEAVRLMGVVAGASGAARMPGPAPRPTSPERRTPPAPRFEEPTAAAKPAAPEHAPAPPAPVAPTEASGLRPRLRLTPTTSDEAFKTVFEPAGGREHADPADESWTWKELLSSMDDAPADDGGAAETLLNEIEAMGIDAGALLPRGRIDDVASALRDGDAHAALAIVRRQAPAAVRRLARRMMSDRTFRGHAERLIRDQHELIAETLDRGGTLSALLASDQGRAFLLIDAASGDVG